MRCWFNHSAAPRVRTIDVDTVLTASILSKILNENGAIRAHYGFDRCTLVIGPDDVADLLHTDSPLIDWSQEIMVGDSMGKRSILGMLVIIVP